MKKSRSITLTVVAVIGVSTASAQNPVPPAAPTDCAQIRKTAQASGATIPSNCASHGGGFWAHGGFGSTAKGHHGGHSGGG